METDPEFKSSLSLSLPEGREHETCWFYNPFSHTGCSQHAQLWAKSGRNWLLGVFSTDYNKRKRVTAKCHFSIQPSQRSSVGTEGGQKAQQTPSGHWVASVSTSWINWSTSFLSVLEFHSKYFCFPYLLRKRPEGWVCLKLNMSLWYLQGTLRKNAAHCSGIYHQPRSDHIRSVACHKLSVSHLGSAEAMPVLPYSAPSTLDAPELPQGYQKAWTGCERQPILSKRWAKIQSLLPQNWDKHKPKSVHSKNLSCPFFTARNLCPCSMKWSWSTVPRESRSALTPSCAWKKGQYLCKNCSPFNTQYGVNPTPQKYIFWFITLVGLLTIFTLENMEWAITCCGIDTAAAWVTQLSSPPQHTLSLNETAGFLFIWLYNTFFTLSQYHHVLDFLVPIQRLPKLFYLPILK